MFYFGRLNSVIAVLITIVLAVFSGWREVGIDRSNYIAMYNGVLSSNDLVVKLWYAKDVFFLIITSISDYFSEDVRLAFLLICTLSIFLKYFYIRKIACKYTLLFIFSYALFLAPGLEFAAMRGGLAIGFMMLALIYRNRVIQFVFFSILAISAHISIIPFVLLSIPYINRVFSKYKWTYIGLFLAIFLSASVLLDLFPHGADYENNQGTVFSLSEPLATLCIAWLVFFRIEQTMRSNIEDELYKNILYIRQLVYGLIAIAFGLAAVVVTASTRYLEISWCLLLIVSIVMYRKTYFNMLGFGLLIALLTYLNIVRFTWLAIVNPALFS